MVWFQCEDCGDNLKKPKLANHFRVCSANKLSCIDCGQVFGQETVQAHTQCITETEKYGPKGQNKASNGTPAKPNSASKPKPDIDINVGLSERPPWFCSLCNTSATSKQTLLSHAEGKKHRAKARGYHAAQQPPKQTEESKPNADDSTGNVQKETENVKETDSVPLSKKRKLEEACKNNGIAHAGVDASSGELGSGEVIHIANAEAENIKHGEKKAKSTKEDTQTKNSSPEEDGLNKAKWKKMITSALKSNPDGSMKMRKLQKYVLKALRESGSKAEEKHIFEKLEHKIGSSSKFTINGKYVQLVTKG